MKNIFRGLVIVAVIGAAFFVNSKPAAAGALAITVTSPNGGEVLKVGQVYRITWTAPSNIDTVWLGYSAGEGSLNWIVTGLANTGYYDWYVDVGNTTNTQFKIEAIGYQIGVGSATDLSDNYFTAAPAVAINQTVLSNARLGEAYNATLTASGGTQTYGWGSTGTLPPGLVFAQIGNTATISGTPTFAGTYNFSVTASSGSSASSMLSDTKQFTLTVDTAGNPVVDLKVNNYTSTGYQEPTVNLGSVSTVTITWNATNATYCNTYGQTQVQLSDGTKWGDLRTLPVSGTRTFSTAGQKAVDGSAMTYASLGIQCWGGYAQSISDTKGILVTWDLSTTPANITVNTPAPGVTWVRGQTYQVTWTTGGTINNTKIRLSSGTSLKDYNISGNPGSYSVVVPTDFSLGNAKLYVMSSDESVWNMVQGYINIADSASFSIVTNSPLPNGQVEKAYANLIGTSTGATATSCSVSVTSGSLPPGTYLLECSTSLGQAYTDLAGTPTTAGTYTFTVQFSLGGQMASKQFTLVIDPLTTSGLNIMNSTLASAQVNQPYQASVVATGGAGPYSWVVASGSLPPGLSLQVSDGKGCVGANFTTCALIVGTPTEAGTHSFYLKLSAKADTVSKQFTIDVLSPVNQQPLGWVDSISSDGVISGWALDLDHKDTPLNVHFYFDTMSSTPWATATAVERTDVNAVMGASGTHGFSLTIPDNYRDGKRHMVYVYAIDFDDASGASNAKLYGTPRTFIVKSNVPMTTRHPRGTVVIGPDGTVYFLGAEIRYPFPTPEIFFSWGHKFAELVVASAGDLAMPVGPAVALKP